MNIVTQFARPLLSLDGDSSISSNALIRKLGRYCALDPSDRDAIDELNSASEWIVPGRCILAYGDVGGFVLPVLEGLAFRHKDFRDGRRQILSLLLPGDICGGQGAPIAADYLVTSLTRVKISRIPSGRFQDLLACHPSVGAALERASIIDQAVLCAWITNLGQRNAHERVAHLLCEVAHRMDECGLTHNGGFELPLTQQALGFALGLTSVHVNRVLQRCRSERLFEYRNGFVEIFDLGRLHAVAGFSSEYLHN